MDKNTITRQSLKSNFLRQTIIRIDHDMLFDKDIQNYIESIYPYLIENGYKMNSNTMSNYNVNINMEELNNIANSINTNTENYTSFKNEMKDIIIDITKEATILTISYNKYETFEEIYRVFSQLVEVLSKIRVGFSFNRIGLRKINVFFIKNIQNINNYLEETAFCLTNFINNKPINFEVKNIIETFKIEEYKVNKNVTAAKGVFLDENKQEKEAYQVMLDIDIYNDEMRDNTENIMNMNDIVFEIYKDSLKYKFLEDLKNENYRDEEILNI